MDLLCRDKLVNDVQEKTHCVHKNHVEPTNKLSWAKHRDFES
jgi:hypothetical protein